MKMQSKNRKRTIRSLLMLIFSITVLFTLVFPSQKFSNLVENDINNSQLPYQPLDLDGALPIGNITILSIGEFSEGTFINESTDPTYGMASPHNIQYEYLTEYPSAFLGVKQIADEDVYDTANTDGALLFTINESVRYDYWYNDTRTVTYFKSTFSASSFSGISNVTINGTGIDFLNQSIFRVVDNGYVLNYSSFRSDDQYPNGTLIVGYEIDYLLRINEWRMIQSVNSRPNYLDEISNNFHVKYNYTLGLGGALADYINLDVTLRITIPDGEYLTIKSMTNYTGTIADITNVTTNDNYILNPNNTIDIEVNLHNYIQFSINSEASFTIEFMDVYTSLWHQDYLYKNRDIRERQFKISCVDGPPSLAASFFSFNITSIPFGDLTGIYSEYIRNGAQGRLIQSGNMSEFGPSDGVIVFSYEDQNNRQYKLFTGETDLITIRYRAWRTLNLTMTDHLNIPISGVGVEVNYQNVTWGTLMSADRTAQIPLKFSDNNGQIQIPNMPLGEFNISIYYKGELIQYSSASTRVGMNRINTLIPHFPTIILAFLITSVAATGIGFYLYKKYQS